MIWLLPCADPDLLGVWTSLAVHAVIALAGRRALGESTCDRNEPGREFRLAEGIRGIGAQRACLDAVAIEDGTGQRARPVVQIAMGMGAVAGASGARNLNRRRLSAIVLLEFLYGCGGISSRCWAR